MSCSAVSMGTFFQAWGHLASMTGGVVTPGWLGTPGRGGGDVTWHGDTWVDMREQGQVWIHLAGCGDTWIDTVGKDSYRDTWSGVWARGNKARGVVAPG